MQGNSTHKILTTKHKEMMAKNPIATDKEDEAHEKEFIMVSKENLGLEGLNVNISGSLNAKNGTFHEVDNSGIRSDIVGKHLHVSDLTAAIKK